MFRYLLATGLLALVFANAAVSSTGEPLARKAIKIARAADAKSSLAVTKANMALSRTNGSPSTFPPNTAGSGLEALQGTPTVLAG